MKEFYPYIKRLIADSLEHFKLDPFNLMVGDSSEFTGVIDWE